MSVADGSCARTRGWQGEHRSFQRYRASLSASSGRMSTDSDSDRSERWSDGGYASESPHKHVSVPKDELGVPSHGADVLPSEVESRDVHITEDDDVPKNQAADKHFDMVRRQAKGYRGKTTDTHDRKSKRSLKTEDKATEKTKKESKKHREQGEKKRSKENKTEKPSKRDSEYYRKDKYHHYSYEKDDYRDDYRDDYKDDYKSYRYHKDGRRESDEYSDDERRYGHWDSGKSQFYKGSSKADRGRGSKWVKFDSDQRSHRGRSPSRSPRKWSRSPSPYYKDREDREQSSRDKSEREGSSKYRRIGGSGLGGYSPRRRRSDAAIKTPSPPARSPERKKPRAWDMAPTGVDSNNLMAAMAAVQQQAAALASVSSLVMMNPAVATVTLTQATRPLRRLYVANVPATVSDGELTEFLNAAMISAGANHLPGTKPCINCMVNPDKNYAFAEFLTPEDTTAALAFDGVTLHGTTLKIRRPKDYVNPVSGGVDTVSTVVDMVSNIVLDSPRKVFVGGICTTLSRDKVKEIVTAFGQLKAYHWEVKVKDNQKEVFAFLEYVDPSVALKACAGLNGMRLGNNILTVVQATPDATDEECEVKKPPFYGIPEHAKTLLEAPTRILELQNVISEEEVTSMSESDLLEIEEDVRLECLRFGTVKSIHVVKPQDDGVKEPLEAPEHDNGDTVSTNQPNIDSCVESVDKANTDTTDSQNTGANEGNADCIVPKPACVDVVSSGEPNEQSSPECENLGSAETDTNVASHQSEKIGQVAEEPTAEAVHSEVQSLQETETVHSEANDCSAGSIPARSEVKDSSNNVAEKPNAQPYDSTLGRVYVEFTRDECARQAAHDLHGRMYGDRKVVAAFFPLKLYQKRFKKGLEPRTYEEKQALAVAALEHLNSYIPDRD